MFTSFVEFYGARGFLIGNFIVRIRCKICFFARAEFFSHAKNAIFDLRHLTFLVRVFRSYSNVRMVENLSAHAKCFRRVHGSHFIPFHACLFTKGNVSSPQGNFILPKGNLISPKRNANSLEGNMIAPKGNMSSPQGNMFSPQGNMISPKGNMISPKRSMISPERNMILPEGNMIPPQGNMISPKGNMVSPKGIAMVRGV